MNSYKFTTNVMCEGLGYQKDSVHQLSDEQARNFGETVMLVQEAKAPVNDTAEVDASDDQKVAPAHPNKMLKSQKATKK